MVEKENSEMEVLNDENESGGRKHGLLPTAYEWKAITFLATNFVQAGALPAGINTVPKAIVILQAGLESGLTPLQAFNSFYIVNGKVTMYGEAVPRQIIKAGHKITWGKCDDKEATVTITRGDTNESMVQNLTWETAVKRGYTKNDVWHKFPENMLKWRALSMCAKFIVPDALNGIQIKEDIESNDLAVDAEVAPKKIETPKAGKVAKKPRKALAEAIESSEEVDIEEENKKLLKKREETEGEAPEAEQKKLL